MYFPIQFSKARLVKSIRSFFRDFFAFEKMLLDLTTDSFRFIKFNFTLPETNMTPETLGLVQWFR